MDAVGFMSEIADEYRRKAEACRRLADLSPEAERKAHWLEQAEEWDRLAAARPPRRNLPPQDS
jgi:hypothetical protein